RRNGLFHRDHLASRVRQLKLPQRNRLPGLGWRIWRRAPACECTRTSRKRSRQEVVSAIQAIPGAVITGLSIVFDEGDDVGSGFAHLDNIEVDVNGTPHIWTSATDNGGSQ